MAFSILFSSCSDLITNHQIDKQAEKLLSNYSGLLSATDCANFKQNIDQIKAYIWHQRNNGINPSRGDIAKKIYDMQVADGTIPTASQNDRTRFADFVQNHSWSGNQEAIIQKLTEENYFSGNVASYLQNFRVTFSQVNSFTQAYAAIDATKNSSYYQALTTQEKSIINQALDGAERSICYQESSQNEVQTRGWCEECNWTIHWVFLIVSVVVTVAAFLFAIITLGLSTLVSSTVLFAVWTATWVLTCIWVWCPDQEICPEGQSPFCEGSFTFDPSIPACTHIPFAPKDFQFNGCIMSPVVNGGCPPGSIKQGQSCLWECADKDIPVKNDAGNWQLPFSCK